jgi:N-acetylglutamate synthase
MQARYVVRITPEDVGERVSVRSRIPAQAGEPTTTDTLGHLRRWAEGTLTLERRDGTLVDLDEGDLLAGRVLPPAPVRGGSR